MLIDTTLDKLPLRQRDNARVVDSARNANKVYSVSAGITYLRRSVNFNFPEERIIYLSWNHSKQFCSCMHGS